MTSALVWIGLVALVAVVARRPYGWGPAIGALVGVALAAAGGAVGYHDLGRAAEAQWRAYITLASVMTMTSSAESFGLLVRLAGLIEPRTRGPVKRAFAVTFVLSALAATVLSNDAAILLLTPTVIALLRAVYPKRHPKFEVAFVFAVFAAAGVAPLLISNPMNLVFADQVGLGFNRYASIMVPIAVVGSLVSYSVLAYCFRAALADEAPALGTWSAPSEPMTRGARAVLVVLASALGAYPLMSYFDAPLWPVAAAGGAICAGVRLVARHRPADLLRGVTWSIFPFLAGVFILAIALERIGVVAQLAGFYRGAPVPIFAIGSVSAIGSAMLNNHPMSVLNALALAQPVRGHDAYAFAALVGGDLGPRLLPVGSLASLLWFDVLRRHGIAIRLSTFVRVGVIVTVPSLAASLAFLWVLTRGG